jgi:hypothetical protein
MLIGNAFEAASRLCLSYFIVRTCVVPSIRGIASDRSENRDRSRSAGYKLRFSNSELLQNETENTKGSLELESLLRVDVAYAGAVSVDGGKQLGYTRRPVENLEWATLT